MVTLRIERRYGTATVRARVTAPTVEQALQLCGADARVVFLKEPEGFFAPQGAAESVKKLPAEAAQRRAEAA